MSLYIEALRFIPRSYDLFIPVSELPIYDLFISVSFVWKFGWSRTIGIWGWDFRDYSVHAWSGTGSKVIRWAMCIILLKATRVPIDLFIPVSLGIHMPGAFSGLHAHSIFWEAGLHAHSIFWGHGQLGQTLDFVHYTRDFFKMQFEANSRFC